MYIRLYPVCAISIPIRCVHRTFCSSCTNDRAGYAGNFLSELWQKRYPPVLSFGFFPTKAAHGLREQRC